MYNSVDPDQICTVCICHFVRNFAVQIYRTNLPYFYFLLLYGFEKVIFASIPWYKRCLDKYIDAVLMIFLDKVLLKQEYSQA